MNFERPIFGQLFQISFNKKEFSQMENQRVIDVENIEEIESEGEDIFKEDAKQAKQSREIDDLQRPTTLKDDVFTISIIGRPNVGKSTLFNRLMGKKLALVDKMPGLTRDRREGISKNSQIHQFFIAQLFDIPIRFVDTAGFEDTVGQDDKALQTRQLNKKMLQDMMKQTRSALIYSDLVLFVLDCREGINYNDVALYKWLSYHKLRLPHEKKQQRQTWRERTNISEQERYQQILQEEEEKYYTKENENVVVDPNMDKKQQDSIQRKRFKKGKYQQDQRIQEFKNAFKNIDKEFMDEEMKVPEIIFLANKSEDGYEGDLLADFYRMFPHIAEEDQEGRFIEPVFISAEHGDGLQDLFQQIEQRVPEELKISYSEKQARRLERYNEYKQQLLDEFIEEKSRIMQEESDDEFDGEELTKKQAKAEDIKDRKDLNAFISHWNKEFERLNPNPEDNSDFDSDNEINPLDTITTSGKYISSKSLLITSENKLKKKPLQLSIVGRPNVGKSTLVNGFLKENRVIANDLAGTTRDSVMVQWIYGGRRINLVDTAGVKLANSIKGELEQQIYDQVKQTIDHSHVVVVLIDSMQAFTNHDMMIIKQVLEEGRAVVIVANKWDLVEDKYKKKALKWMEKQLEKGIGQSKGLPMCFISAKTGHRMEKIMEEVMRVYEKWNTRVSTALLNKWIWAFQRVQKMPTDEGKTLKLRFLMQIKTRPPTFFMYVNNRNLIDEQFERFLKNSISNEFGFQGCPLRLLIRDNKLQYSRKGLSQINASTRAVLKRIDIHRQKMKNQTYRRRLAGNRKLYNQ